MVFNRDGGEYIGVLLNGIEVWEWNDGGEVKWDCIWYSSGGDTFGLSLAPNNFLRISCTSDGFDRSSCTCSIGGTRIDGDIVEFVSGNGGGGSGGGRGGGGGYKKQGVFW